MACCPILAITENESSKVLVRCHPGRELCDLAAGSYHAAPHTPMQYADEVSLASPIATPGRPGMRTAAASIGGIHARSYFAFAGCSLRKRGDRSARA